MQVRRAFVHLVQGVGCATKLACNKIIKAEEEG